MDAAAVDPGPRIPGGAVSAGLSGVGGSPSICRLNVRSRSFSSGVSNRSSALRAFSNFADKSSKRATLSMTA